MSCDNNHSSLHEEAFQLFGRVITRSDPGRLEAWVGLGLTMTQLRVLFLLRAEQRASAGTLAERLGVTPSTLTRVMDRLVKNRLVRREPDEADRRQVLHFLTDRGLRAVEELERTGRARMDAILGHLDAGQLERLVSALRDLSAAIEAVDSESKPGVQL